MILSVSGPLSWRWSWRGERGALGGGKGSGDGAQCEGGGLPATNPPKLAVSRACGVTVGEQPRWGGWGLRLSLPRDTKGEGVQGEGEDRESGSGRGCGPSHRQSRRQAGETRRRAHPGTRGTQGAGEGGRPAPGRPIWISGSATLGAPLTTSLPPRIKMTAGECKQRAHLAACLRGSRLQAGLRAAPPPPQIPRSGPFAPGTAQCRPLSVPPATRRRARLGTQRGVGDWELLIY